MRRLLQVGLEGAELSQLRNLSLLSSRLRVLTAFSHFFCLTVEVLEDRLAFFHSLRKNGASALLIDPGREGALVHRLQLGHACHVLKLELGLLALTDEEVLVAESLG